MNKKIFSTLSLIFLLAILVAIPLTIRLSQEKQEIRLKAAPATVLSVLPATSNKIISETFKIDIEINSGGNAVFGADLEILFNPAVLEARDIEAGDFLDSPQELAKTINNQTGKIIYSLGSFSSKTGRGILALITFKAKSRGNSEILFGPTTSVAAAGEKEGLASTQKGVVNVVDKVNMSFKIKLQGINQQRPNKTVRVILKQGGQEKYRFDSIIINSNQNGVYSGTVTNIDPGIYNVFIKGWAHLTKKFNGISLREINNSLDWTTTELLVGDATGDDKINIQDFRILVEDYLKSESPADFNLDRKVNIQDFRFIVENYLKEGEK